MLFGGWWQGHNVPTIGPGSGGQPARTSVPSSRRLGCECIAHALQGLTELDPEATITSLDGVGAFDLVSRRAMLEGLQRVSAEAVPFARMFYGRRSECLWESDAGEVHNIPQGEGGEQGDAMMPLLFSLGQHGALQDASRTLGHGEHLMAFLDDTYFVRKPARVGPIHGSLENALWRNAGIRIHIGKTGTKRESDPRFAMLWRGERERSTQQQQCGEARCCQPTDKASNCWGRRWAIPTSLPGTSGPSRKSIKSSCNEFHA